MRKNIAEGPYRHVHEAICGERILFPVEVCRPGGAVSVGRGFRTERAPLVPCVHVSPVSQLVVGHIVSGAAATDGAPAGRGEGPPPGTAGTPQPSAAHPHPHLQPTPDRTFPSSHRPSAGRPPPSANTAHAPCQWCYRWLRTPDSYSLSDQHCVAHQNRYPGFRKCC